MLRLRTLFLCPSNRKSKNQQNEIFRVCKKGIYVKLRRKKSYPKFFRHPVHSLNFLSVFCRSRDSRRWRSSNKSANVHLTVNAGAVRLVSSVPAIAVKVWVSRLDFVVSAPLPLFCREPCWTHYPTPCIQEYFKKYFKTSHAWDENLIWIGSEPSQVCDCSERWPLDGANSKREKSDGAE